MSGPTDVLAALSDAVGAERAEQLLARFDRYSNQPHAVRGASRLPSDPALERAALRVFEDPDLGAAAGLDASSLAGALDARALWALLALAARADVTVLDRLPAEAAERGAPKVASIRRAVAKHAAASRSDPSSPAAPTSPPAPAGDDVPVLPEKVAQVGRWLDGHPGADPRWFAARPGQRAAERRAALRAPRAAGGVHRPPAAARERRRRIARPGSRRSRTCPRSPSCTWSARPGARTSRRCGTPPSSGCR
ncbi:hypothetical protein CBR64_00710 [Cellulosimicrobium cellulans]|uniref:DUF222 domain-containing protein n=1 Tax=Cellulosimicrobium cellulans TaxID=1710 RepID=A0A1Y0HQ37_CELCE|nr:hypothetical protein CBR64_00710 [Cellulosimicrobium cellulans]